MEGVSSNREPRMREISRNDSCRSRGNDSFLRHSRIVAIGDARPARDTSRRARGEDVAGIISIDPVDLDERARDERGRHERRDDEAEQGG